MKSIFLYLLLLIFCFSAPVFGQEKGVTPTSSNVNRSSSTVRAVVIGISDYQDAAIPDLRFADRDADAFAAFLRSPAGGSLDADHLQVLTNQNATAGRIAEALDALLEQAKEGDQVIIYYSGHGDVERKTVSQPGFLLCWDAPARVYMGGGTYSLAYLQEIVTTLTTQNQAKVVVVTDACHAGKLAGSQISGAQLTAANLARQFANEVKILSCQPGELSLEGEQWGGGRGIFSYHLVDGLFGLADKNADGFVTLGELDRYLEDNVTAEAAPQSQVPMVLGNKTERLAMVNAPILADLKKAKAGGLSVFAPIESRGLEEEILAQVDTSIRVMYQAFKLAVKEKRFFEPAGNCAEDLYSRLEQVEALAPLQGMMKRNYAAALQDDAQQVLNTMLKTGLTELVLSGAIEERLYERYPLYLGRAADLLGKDHYLYPSLMARQAFFKGKTAKTKAERKQHFLQALAWQPEMPHAMLELGVNEGVQQLDSAIFYLLKTAELLPGWILPHVKLSDVFIEAGLLDSALVRLDIAGRIDSTAVLVWYEKAFLYRKLRRFDKAEAYFLKVTQHASDEICFPCAYMGLGGVYMNTGRLHEAKVQYLKAIEQHRSNPANSSDFCNPCAFINLGTAYLYTDSAEAAIAALKKAIEVDSTYAIAYGNLGGLYLQVGNYGESEKYLKKAVQMEPNEPVATMNLGELYRRTKRFKDAQHYLLKSLELDSTQVFVHIYLAIMYFETQQYDFSEKYYRNAIRLNAQSLESLDGLGCVFVKTGRFKEAAQQFNKVLQINPNYNHAYHGLACAESLQKNPCQGFEYLEKALQEGYNDKESLKTDPDLAFLRKQKKQWNALMKKYFPEGGEN